MEVIVYFVTFFLVVNVGCWVTRKKRAQSREEAERLTEDLGNTPLPDDAGEDVVN